VLIVSVAAFLNSGMSAHMIPILTGLGLSAGVAVWATTLRGVGQSLARLGEVLFGGRLDPLALGLLASSFLPVAFVAGLFGGASALAGAAFAFAYGAGNGLLTITRGTQPLVLFDPRTYGTLVGSLTAPAFFLSALAPVVYALVIERASEAAALYLSAGLAVLVFGASALLAQRFRP
jgi:hypothetical protein